MKKSILLLIILTTVFLVSCQKFETVVDETTNPETTVVDHTTGSQIINMSDLVISDSFNWSMIKTMNVQVTLPEDDKDRILYIYSQDGKRLYFKGHTEDGSNVLRTKVTVPTYESVLYIKYGVGENYPEAGSYLSGNNLNFNINTSYKSAYLKTGGGDDDCGPCQGQFTSITLKYIGSETNATIKVYKDRVEAGKLIYTAVNISNGDVFTATNGGDKMGAKIRITISNTQGYTEMHTSCSPGTVEVGDVVGGFEVIAGISKDGGDLCGSDPDPDPDPECGPCDGGLTSLTLRYQGNLTNATIRVYEGNSIGSGSLIHTETNVSFNTEFTFDDGGDRMHPKVKITFNGNNGNFTEMHTSCSPGTVEVGDVVDDFLVIAGISKNGGDLCGSTPDPDPEPECEDGDYDSTTFGGFTFEYVGMTEDINTGTSTWTYTVKGDNPENPDYKNLYLWSLTLCDDEHTVTDANYNGFESDNSDYLDFYGIRWNESIDKVSGEKTFSFTLDKQYDVVPVEIGFKNYDGDLFYCEIYGPSCEGPPPDPPEEEVFGTIAFEDLWPGKGDYDINDLVIEYDFAVTKDNNEWVESITATFEIRCFGAGLHNAFGFTFPNVDPSDIVSVIGYDIVNTGAFSLASNGTENGQSKATFILYDDTYRLMQHPGSGIGVNTDHPAPYVTPAELTLTIVFANHAVTYSQLDIGNFNPFIVKHQDRNVEIHLPDYPPTDLADDGYFGTFDDDTNPPSKYYLTENNLPWAILIPDRFDYPIEKQPIIGAYNFFDDWAQGDGIANADWYKDLPGYRNASVIY